MPIEVGLWRLGDGRQDMSVQRLWRCHTGDFSTQRSCDSALATVTFGVRPYVPA